MRYIGLAFAGAFLLGGCTTLITPSGSAATRWAALEKSRAAKANPGANGEQICKNMVVMGSNFPQKVCSTKAEWEAFDEVNHESVDSFDTDRRAGNTQGAFEN